MTAAATGWRDATASDDHEGRWSALVPAAVGYPMAYEGREAARRSIAKRVIREAIRNEHLPIDTSRLAVERVDFASVPPGFLLYRVIAADHSTNPASTTKVGPMATQQLLEFTVGEDDPADVTSALSHPLVIAAGDEHGNDWAVIRRKSNGQRSVMTYAGTTHGRRAAELMMGRVRLAVDGAYLCDVRLLAASREPDGPSCERCNDQPASVCEC